MISNYQPGHVGYAGPPEYKYKCVQIQPDTIDQTLNICSKAIANHYFSITFSIVNYIIVSRITNYPLYCGVGWKTSNADNFHLQSQNLILVSYVSPRSYYRQDKTS